MGNWLGRLGGSPGSGLASWALVADPNDKKGQRVLEMAGGGPVAQDFAVARRAVVE